MAFSVRAARRVSRGTDDETVFRTRYVKCSGAAAAERTHSIRSAGGREGELDFGRQSHPMAIIRTDKEMEKGEENECTQSRIDAINLEGDIDCRDRRSNRIGREGEGESVQSMTATRMHALVDKVPIAMLVADQRESWPTLAFLDGRGQVPALVPSPWSRLRWQHNEEE